ncbi:hypothetical protein [Saccharopolyspora phatthalungensis]|uniref:Uncharacterized protein n=1 Tax=Saccharopolyspora phatthalungensis TaxID=664693 RepID=A0A840Q391_9PSEU|nr:hypothetical protein [Saccharopolyspora phatthalungensis]MBB5154071.1 hypothetical protein [Saccharopolyspora phatthalungensis]
MAAKTGRSGVATLINGAGFLLAVLLVLHIVFVLTGFAAENGLAQSVAQAAEPLVLFFPGLVHAKSEVLQVLLDYGLAAAFWVLLCGVLARVFG